MLKTICSFSLLIVALAISAQEGETQITETYENEPLINVLSDLTQKYNLRLFYKQEWLAEETVTVEITNKSTNEALAMILRETELSHAQLSGSVFVLLKEERKQASNYTVTLNGRVIDGNTNEPVPNVYIRIPEIELTTLTDLDGSYRLQVPAGTYLITAKSINSDVSRTVKQLYEDQTVDLEVFEEIIELEDVVITGQSPDENISSTNPGKLTFNLESIRKLPNLLGETDLTRVILSLPGVQTIGEGATGFNVRGGAIDQNLILMDGVPVYNSSHLLGFFSIFNPDVTSNFSIYKGNIPASYGGRLSSVVNVELKKPSVDKFSFTAGLGPISNKASVNLPVVKDKFSLVAGARYSNPTWILRSINDSDINQSAANFFDVNLKGTLILSDKDVLNGTFYSSDDFFDFGSDTAFSYQTKVIGLTWDHEFSKRWYGSLGVFTSDYKATLMDGSPFRQFDLDNGIRTRGTRMGIDFKPSEQSDYRFGFELEGTDYRKGIVQPTTPESEIEVDDYGQDQSIKWNIYLENERKIGNRLTLAAGIRYSNFSLREINQFVFDPNQPKSSISIIDTLNSGAYKQLYDNWEPRISLSWRLNQSASFKGSYTRAAQYEQLFSNSTASLPTDLWIPVSNSLLPALSDQYSIGFFKNLADNKWETSVEVYYKNFLNVNLLKTGAEVLQNETIEADIVPGEGQSFGTEFLVKKTSGNVSGWLSYFYSRTEFVTKNQFLEDQINNGRIFLADFDRPHNINLSLNFQLSRLWSMSTNFVYNTGRPVTVPSSSYALQGVRVFERDGVRVFNVDERNNIRTPDNHRLDLSFTLEGSNKKNKRLSSSFTFSIYNVYGRNNPFAIVTKSVNNTIPRTFNLTVLGNAIPSFTYNLKFE